LQQLFGWRPLDHHHHHNTHHHGQEEGFHDPREEEEVEDPAEEEGCRGAEEGAGEESCREAEGHLRAMRHQEGHRERQRGRAQEDCQGVLRQVVQLGGRNVLPPERGHPQGPANQRAQHVRLRHEGQVHQAHPQEGLQVREQVCQAPRKGSQVRVREPAQSQGQVKVLSHHHTTTPPKKYLTRTVYININHQKCIKSCRHLLLAVFTPPAPPPLTSPNSNNKILGLEQNP